MRPMTLSKTDFMRYLTCPAYAWMAKHRKELVPEEADRDLLERRFATGDEIERYALALFPPTKRVTAFGERGATFTKTLIEEGKEVIHQATALSPEGYLARADILVKDGTAGWKLYEVKSSTAARNRHLPDVTFQKLVFERAGIPITAVAVIHLNRFYRRKGALDPKKLLRTTAVNAKVKKMERPVSKRAAAAFEYLSSPVEPTTCTCLKKPRWEHCPTFRHFHPDVPEYSIFHVSGIGKRTIKDLVDRKAFEVHDVPDGVKLKERGKNQVLLAREGKPVIKEAKIRERLDALEFPLYFLDYETTTNALPLFEGCRPYQNMPFQYSLHVLESPDAEPAHLAYLATNETADPVTELLTRLQRDVGERGTVIVWNKRFEMGCNDEMAKMRPAFADFLGAVNERTFDLMEIFSDQHYLHPDFRGSASIKKVLPVLVPDLSYDDLDVSDGARASAHWEDALDPDFDPAARQKLYADLEKYCGLDTLAMVRVYEHLREICGDRTPEAGHAAK